MITLRAAILIVLALSVIGAGAFGGASLSQPALLALLPWVHFSDHKI